MAKIFPEIDNDYLKFYKKGFITNLGFFVKAVHEKGSVLYRDIENDDKEVRKDVRLKYKDEQNIAGVEVKYSGRVETDKKQKLKSSWNLKEYFDNSRIDHNTNYDKTTQEHNTSVRFVKGTEDESQVASLGFTVDEKNKIDLELCYSRTLTSILTVATQIDVNLSNFSLRQTCFGILVHPFSWLNTWIVHNTNGKFHPEADWQDNTNLTVMNRMSLGEKTELAFDLMHRNDFEYLLGIESGFSEKWKIRSKIGSLSDFEVSIRYSPISNLLLTFGLRGEYDENIEKQGCSIGFGIEANFDKDPPENETSG
ncbi:unnamed protein product [Moneuplotes crassus]|uniref:Uncharacterized protein n=1 Tax=Euplotes crassus TaxID=5936 RepID=A0AAD2D0Z1_EUPCR|nr:unnamed protein product [Moneuplotes crassus]